MSTNKTPNYQLNQWEPQDAVLREEFNQDNAKIDTALAGKAEQRDMEAVQIELGRKGDCRIVTGTYVGTGTFGPASPKTLSFDGKPLILFATGERFFFSVYGDTYTTSEAGNAGSQISISWQDSTVSWYSHDNAGLQLNHEGTTYRYVALLSNG